MIKHKQFSLIQRFGAMLVVVAAAVIVCMQPFEAIAQGGEAECPKGDLLKGKMPAASSDLTSRLPTDGRLAREGIPWDSAEAMPFSGVDEFITWDLGRSIQIKGLLLQGDDNDIYEVWGGETLDAMAPIWRARRASGGGLRSRSTRSLSTVARFVAVKPVEGDDFYSLSELRAYCQPPKRFPRVAAAKKGAKSFWDRDKRMGLANVFVGLGGFLVILGALLGLAKRRRRLLAQFGVAMALGVTGFMTAGFWGMVAAGTIWIAAVFGAPKSKLSFERRAAWLALICCLVGWGNFFTFHGSRNIHYWDSFHYYVGGKYFQENGYELMYHCAQIAQSDDGRSAEITKRKVRNLSTNELGFGDAVLKVPEPCRAAFSPQRWRAFRQDLRYFRAKMGASWFGDAFKDHGFNATPVWIMAGDVLTNWGWLDDVPTDAKVAAPVNPEYVTKANKTEIDRVFAGQRDAFVTRLGVLTSLDGALYVGILLLLVWAFGLEVAVFSACVWVVGHPWAYYWTGGGFGRVPWLFSAVLGLCLVKRGYAALGGAGLAWSLLLRVFPGALFGGLGLAVLRKLIVERNISPVHRRFIAGAAAGLIALVGMSFVTVGGPQTYSDFLANSLKHKATPLTNHMGLPTLMSFHPGHLARYTKDSKLADPYGPWKETRRRLLHERQIVYVALLLALFGAVFWASGYYRDWELVSISTLFIFALFELTSYYYSFVILMAPLAFKRPRHALALMAMVVGTQIAHLSVGWFDERYLIDSLLVGAALIWIFVDETLTRHRAENPPEDKVPPKGAQA